MWGFKGLRILRRDPHLLPGAAGSSEAWLLQPGQHGNASWWWILSRDARAVRCGAEAGVLRAGLMKARVALKPWCGACLCSRKLGGCFGGGHPKVMSSLAVMSSCDVISACACTEQLPSPLSAALHGFSPALTQARSVFRRVSGGWIWRCVGWEAWNAARLGGGSLVQLQQRFSWDECCRQRGQGPKPPGRGGEQGQARSQVSRESKFLSFERRQRSSRHDPCVKIPPINLVWPNYPAWGWGCRSEYCTSLP